MENFAVTDPKKVLAALSEGQKIAVFAVDEQKKPLFFVSDINIRVSQNFVKTEDILAVAEYTVWPLYRAGQLIR